MKQCILFIIVLLISNNVFAQNHSDIYAKASDMEVTDKKQNLYLLHLDFMAWVILLQELLTE